ncbi:hypothetical protein V5298_18050, partial [Alteromonas sp. 14N.309.X.WAT.G.H12]
LKGGAKALKGKGPVQLRWIASTLGKSQALKTEYQLKRLSRQQKNALIRHGKTPLTAPFDDTLVCTTFDLA